LEIVRTLFLGNSSDGNGGALCAKGTQVKMASVLFVDNASGYEGGAVMLDVHGGCGNLEMTNVTFRSNHAGSVGGAMSNFGQCPVSMVNVIMVENTADNCGGIEGALETVAGYCDLWGNVPNNHCTWDYEHGGPDGNVILPPEFVDTTGADPGTWDLHLGTTSPLVDAGDPELLDPDGSVSDMGAFGGPGAGGWDLDSDGYPSWWQPGPYDPATYPALGLDCDDLDPNVHPGSGC